MARRQLLCASLAIASCLCAWTFASEATSEAASRRTSCAPTLAATIANTGRATQLVTVVAPTATATRATVTLFTKVAGCWRTSSAPIPGRIGRTGITRNKHEGDGATPAGLFGFLPTFYGNRTLHGTHFAYRSLHCGDWWDEDSASSTYNRFVEVPCSETNPPFNNGASEPLWKSPLSYAMFAVLAYNTTHTPGRGSAIFMHVDGGGPTTGCIALAAGPLGAMLKWLEPQKAPLIAIGTPSTIGAY